MTAKSWSGVLLLALLVGGLVSQVARSAKESETGTVASSTAATHAASSSIGDAVTDESSSSSEDDAPAADQSSAASNPAAYLPVQRIPADIDDPAFNRYVDLTLLARAWEARNASLMADVAIQLSEGERILQRPHRSLSSAKLLELTARIALDSRDKALLDRLGHIADQSGQDALKAQMAAASKLSGETRAIEPGATVSVDEMSPNVYAAFYGLKTQIEAARIAESGEALDHLQHNLAGFKQLPEKHRKYLEKLVAESRTAISQHAQRQPSIVSMDKLVAASHGGARSWDSDAVLPVVDGAIPSDVADPAFDRYVDLHLLGLAWDRGDAVLMTDVALQLLEGQRILLRPHRAITPQKVLELAARLAIEKRDQATLQRLAKLADQQGEPSWKAPVAAALKLGGEARAVNPALTFSVDDISPEAYAAIQDLLDQIQISRAARDAKGLESLKGSLAELGDIPAKQRNYLEQLLADSLASFKGMNDPQQDALTDALNKLSDASRGGHGHPGGSHGSSHAPRQSSHPSPAHVNRSPGASHPHVGNRPPAASHPPAANHPKVVNRPPKADHPRNANRPQGTKRLASSNRPPPRSRGPERINMFRHRHHHWHWYHPEGGAGSWVEDDGPDDGDEPDPDVYAAIAYSTSTGLLGSATNFGSAEDAQAAALDSCNADDAQVVVWCKNAYCAFAKADDGTYGAAWADTQDDAESQALAACTQDSNPQVYMSIGAGDPPAE